MHAYSVGYAQKLTLNDTFIRIRSKKTTPQNLTAFIFDFSPTNGRISNIEPLERYKHLTELSLVGHKFVDIKYLGNLVALKQLNLSWNAIRNIKPLMSMVALEVLNLGHNAISELPVSISHLTQLKVLNLGFNRIVEKDEVRHLQSNSLLENVEFDGNTFMNDENGSLFVVFALPQISVLNRRRVTRETRIQATERFAPLINSFDQESESPKTISRTISVRPEFADEDSISRINELKKQLAESKRQEGRLKVSQRQKTKATVPVSPIPKQTPDFQVRKLKQENAELLEKVRKLEADADYHRSEIEAQKKRIRELNKSQSGGEDAVKEIQTLRAQCQSKDEEISELRREQNEWKLIRSELTNSFQAISDDRNAVAEEKDERIQTLEEALVQRGEVIQGLRRELREKEQLIQEMKQNQQFEDVSESNWSTEILQTELAKSLSAVDEERERSQFERVNKKQTDQIKKLKKEITVLRDKLDESDRICAQLLDANDKSKKLVEAASDALSAKDRQIEQLKAERAGFVAQMSHEIRLRDTKIEELEDNLEHASFFVKPHFTTTFDSDEDETLQSSSEMSINSAQRQVLNSQKEISSCRAKISNQESTIESLKSALLAAQDRIHDLNDELRKKQQQILEQEKAHQELSERVSEQESEVRQVVSHLKRKISALKMKTDDTELESNSTFESLRKQLESKERELTASLQNVTSKSRSREESIKKELKETQSQLLDALDLQAKLLLEVENLAIAMSVRPGMPIGNLSNDNFASFQQLIKQIKEKHAIVQKEVHALKTKGEQEAARYSSSISRLEGVLSKKEESNASLRQELKSLSQQIQHQNEEQVKEHKADTSLKLSQLEESSEISFSFAGDKDNEESTIMVKSPNEAEYERTISRLSSKKQSLKEENRKLSRQVDALQSALASKSKEISRLSENALYRSDLSSSVQALEQKSQVKELSLMKEITEVESRLRESRMKEECLQKELDNANSMNTALNSKVRKLKRKLTESQIENNQLRQRMNEQSETHATLIAEKEQEVSECLGTIDDLRDQLMNATDDFNASQSSIANEKHEIEMDLVKSQAMVEQMSKKLLRLSKRFEQVVITRNESEAVNTDLRKENAKLKEDLTEASDKIKRITALHDTTEHLFKTLSKKHIDLQNEYQALQESVSSETASQQRMEMSQKVEQTERENRKLKRIVQKLQAKLSRTEQTNTKNESELTSLQQEVQTLRGQKQENELRIHRFMDKLRVSEEAFGKLNASFMEITQFNRALEAQIAEMKAQMINRTEHEELRKKLETKRNNAKEKIAAQEKTLLENDRTIAIQSSEIQKLEERLRTSEKELETLKDKHEKKVKALKDKLTTKQREVDKCQTQIDEMCEEIDALKDNVHERDDSLETLKEEQALRVRDLEQKMKELGEEVTKKEQTITEQAQQKKEIEDQWASASADIELQKQKYEQERVILSEKEQEQEAQYEAVVRQLSKAKREIRTLQEEKDQFDDFLAEKEMHIHQLSVRLDGTVKKSAYDELVEKYNEAKQLKMFSEQKARSVDWKLEKQKEELMKHFQAKEESLLSEIQELKKNMTRQCSANRKLMTELQRLTRKLNAYVDPNSEKVPREELVIYEEKLGEVERDLKVLQEQHETVISENEKLRDELLRKEQEVRSYEEKQKGQVDRLAAVEAELDTKAQVIENVERVVRSIDGVFGNERMRDSKSAVALKPLFSIFKASDGESSPSQHLEEEEVNDEHQQLEEINRDISPESVEKGSGTEVSPLLREEEEDGIVAEQEEFAGQEEENRHETQGIDGNGEEEQDSHDQEDIHEEEEAKQPEESLRQEQALIENETQLQGEGENFVVQEGDIAHEEGLDQEEETGIEEENQLQSDLRGEEEDRSIQILEDLPQMAEEASDHGSGEEDFLGFPMEEEENLPEAENEIVLEGENHSGDEKILQAEEEDIDIEAEENLTQMAEEASDHGSGGEDFLAMEEEENLPEVGKEIILEGENHSGDEKILQAEEEDIDIEAEENLTQMAEEEDLLAQVEDFGVRSEAENVHQEEQFRVVQGEDLPEEEETVIERYDALQNEEEDDFQRGNDVASQGEDEDFVMKDENISQTEENDQPADFITDSL